MYKYTESPNLETLLFRYAVDGGEVQFIDRAQGEVVLVYKCGQKKLNNLYYKMKV